MKKKNVVITGATKGIGRAIVELLAEEGYNVAFCARTSTDIKELTAELVHKYPQQQFFGGKADVSQKEDIVAFANDVKHVFETIDVLVNNAGIFLPGTILNEQEGILEKQLSTNLISAYTFVREFASDMIQRGEGDIINMCSIAGIQPYPNGGSYCISKFAMRGMSMVLREELKDKGVRVTTISPGGTWSDSWAGVELRPERLMPASDIAKAVLMAIQLDRSSVLEEIILRPQLGDL